MSIKIGDQTFATKRPKDLNEALAQYSLSEAEMVSQLHVDANADVIARAVKPFLPAEAPSVPELAAMIAGDRAAAVEGVRGLYKADDSATEKTA